jgi:hypothetical protein
MSEVHQQALVEAPVSDVWDLVGDPRRYPEWLPRVMEINGERFDEGSEFIQVTRQPLGQEEIHFLIDHRDELQELRMHCVISGMFVHWRLTEAQGSTFVDASFGMDPIRPRDKVIDATVGRRFLRRWLGEAVDGLKRAARPRASSAAP